MTAPYYTATAGPADPNAPLMQKVYSVVGGILTLVGAASAFGVFNATQVAALNNLGTQILGLAGGAVAVIAAFRTKKQLGNGTFDKAPEPAAPLTPSEHVATGVGALTEQAAVLTAEKDKITKVFTDALGGVPVVGDTLAKEAKDLLASIPVGLNLP